MAQPLLVCKQRAVAELTLANAFRGKFPDFITRHSLFFYDDIALYPALVESSLQQRSRSILLNIWGPKIQSFSIVTVY